MIFDTNSVSLSGRMNDCSFKTTKKGNAFFTFSIAINRGDKESIWIRLMIFDDKQLEYIKSVNPEKGDRIWIHGIITTMVIGKNRQLQIQVHDIGISKTKDSINLDNLDISSEVPKIENAIEVDDDDIF